MPYWFRKSIEPGTIIDIDQPVPSRWKIVQKLSEQEWQLTEAEYRRGERLSFAVTKLLCCDPKKPSTLAFMRIYLQIPYSGTEIEDADTRATQATPLIPGELLYYQDLTAQDIGCTPKLLGYKVSTQDNRGPVSGGFAVHLAWENVPGVRLGNKDGSNEFWALDNAERNEIRQYFEQNLQALWGIGSLTPPRLVACCFIGFRHRNIASAAYTEHPPLDVTEQLAFFGLVEPESRAWLKEGWDRDTTKWKW
ncbi:hypothetical protein N7454_010830 [Penicillium verhagenii]|nr:hypothetical protein N7454_010830 [Penicillium verhagenii]